MQAFMQFLNDAWLVVLIVLAIVAGLLLWKIGPKNLKAYFSTKDGLGVLKGIVAAPIVIILIALALFAVSLLLPSKAHAGELDTGFRVPGTWFNDASVFMGLDQTRKAVSPQCQDSGPDTRTTSNMGARMNIWQSDSKNVRVNAQYTHHSCAISPDRQSYDGIGIQVEWRIWSR